MTSALRRSRRAAPAKTSNFNVGDIVEINRSNSILKGVLSYNITEGGPSSSNPLWLVKLDNQKEEELYEHTFRKVPKSATEIDKLTMPPPSLRRTRQSSSSEGDHPKRVTFSESSPTASDDSSGSMDGNNGNNSAREQRSRRRQVKVDHESRQVVHNARKRSRAPLTDNAPANKKAMRNNEEVVVVKLLTGTLYLYKGQKRRAEFVRQV